MDRPILFSGPMVRALLGGRKTQTRRVVKPQPPADMGLVGIYAPKLTAVFGYETPDADHKITLRYMPGDRLWVRENISIMPRTAYALPKTVSPDDPDMAAYYQADFDRSGKPRWRPSIHMPRWASRLTLTVTDVRVQRLQEIGEEDARAEGVEPSNAGVGPEGPFKTYRTGFVRLWNSINAERGFGWLKAPWVVAVSFTVERRNIDEVA